MAAKFMQTVLTPAVMEAQEHYYGNHQVVNNAPETDTLTPEEIAFIEARDSFYMASINQAGWPYMQHRGGPVGFLKVLGPNKIGFADFKGNRQLVSTGNVATNDRVALFLMDYPHRERLKLLGHAQVLDARTQPDLVQQLGPKQFISKVERIFVIDIVSYDWNCPQHITQRFSPAEIEQYAAPLYAKIADLEAQVAALKAGK